MQARALGRADNADFLAVHKAQIIVEAAAVPELVFVDLQRAAGGHRVADHIEGLLEQVGHIDPPELEARIVFGVQAVLPADVLHEGVQLFDRRLRHGISPVLKFGVGRLPHESIERIVQIQQAQIVRALLPQHAAQLVQAQILHGLGKDLGKVHAAVDAVAHVGLSIVAELMRDGDHIGSVAVGIGKEEGRVVVIEIGLIGHVGLDIAHGKVTQLVGAHEIIGLGDLSAETVGHGLQHAVKLILRHVALHEIILTVTVHAAGVDREDVGLHALEEGTAILHGKIPVKADVEHHFPIA